jgi:hypothetical protein
MCAFSNVVFALFGVGVLLLLLTLITVANLDQLSPAASIIAQANLVLLVPLLLVSGYVLYRCRD